MTDDLLVQLFYAAQGDITRFRIKARKLLADDGKGGAGDAFDEEDAFQEWWKTRTGKMTNAYHGWMARAALASSDAQADGGKGEAVAWLYERDIDGPNHARYVTLHEPEESERVARAGYVVTPLTAQLAECKGEAVGVAGSMPGTDGFTMAAFKASDVPIGTKIYTAPQAECAPRAIPSVCDGKEQDEFEAWAQKEKYDMSQHPLHWLFLNERTYAARQGWKAALEYVERAIEQAAKEKA